MKEAFRMSVAVANSFRVIRSVENRASLLINLVGAEFVSSAFIFQTKSVQPRSGSEGQINLLDCLYRNPSGDPHQSVGALLLLVYPPTSGGSGDVA